MILHGIRPEVIAALSQTPEVAKQVRTVANAVRKEARRRAPKDTGNLRRNITVTREYDKASGRVTYRVGIGPKAFYGSFIELGSENIPAQPFLRPAADAVAGGGVTVTDGDND